MRSIGMDRMRKLLARYSTHAFIAAALVAAVKIFLLLLAILYGKELLK